MIKSILRLSLEEVLLKRIKRIKTMQSQQLELMYLQILASFPSNSSNLGFITDSICFVDIFFKVCKLVLFGYIDFNDC